MSKNVNVNALIVKSLSMHLSAGVVGKAATSTFLNYDLRTRTAPGIEYNVFPYSESTRRMLTVQYTVGFNTNNYREETIFEKTSERLLVHQIATTFSMRQPWGSSAPRCPFRSS